MLQSMLPGFLTVHICRIFVLWRRVRPT